MPLDRKPRNEQAKHRKRGTAVDWAAVREHWLVMNLNPLRDPKLGEYTLGEVADVFRLAKKTVRAKSASDQWRAELIRRREEVAEEAVDLAAQTAAAVEAKIREDQIKIAGGLVSLLVPIIKGYHKRIDDEGCLKVNDRELATFLRAMKEAREAAGFGKRIEVVTGEQAATERIARHRERGGLLDELLAEISADDVGGS